MATAEPTYDCFHDMPEVEPNGDISGPGVLAGFLGTAYLAIFVLAGYYLVAFDPKQDPYRQRLLPFTEEPSRKPSTEVSDGGEEIEMDDLSSHQGDTTQQHDGPHAGESPPADPLEDEEDWAPNPIDIWFLNNVRKLLHIRRYRRSDDEGEAEVEKAFNECMRSICDNQLMTGIGILLSAYCILQTPDGQGVITAYHWKIAVYLAWLSNLTHTTGLTFLRKYLAHYKTERLWRTLSMTALFLFIFVPFQPLVYFNWAVDDVGSEAQPSNASSNAVCFFRLDVARERMRISGSSDPIPYSSGSSAIISMFLLFFSFCTRMIKLSRTSSRFVRISIRKWCSDKTKAFIDHLSPRSITAGDEGRPVLATSHSAARSRAQRLPMKTRLRYFLGTMGMATLLTGRLYFDLFTSMLSEVYWAFVAGAWVSVRIFEARNSAEVDEDMVSFGQILAVFLLVSPVVTTFVALWPLRSALRELRESRDPASGELRHVDTFPAAQSSAADVYCQFADSATSYDTLGTTLIVSGACFMIVYATALYFWGVASSNSSGIDTIINVVFLAFGQPCCCFCAYLGTTRAAGRYSQEHPDSVTEATDGAEPATEPASAEPASGTLAGPGTSTEPGTHASTEQAMEMARTAKAALNEQRLLYGLIGSQFILFPALSTVGMTLLDVTFLFIFLAVQPPLSYYMFMYFEVFGRRVLRLDLDKPR